MSASYLTIFVDFYVFMATNVYTWVVYFLCQSGTLNPGRRQLDLGVWACVTDCPSQFLIEKMLKPSTPPFKGYIFYLF
jgi:hypothetical protein